jgi:hypothetical protein
MPYTRIEIKSKMIGKKETIQTLYVDMDIENSQVFLNNYIDTYKFESSFKYSNPESKQK